MPKHVFAAAAAALGAVLALAPAPGAEEARPLDSHAIEITVDMAIRTVTGTDTITVWKDTGEVRLLLRSGSTVDDVELSGAKLGFSVANWPGGGANEITISLPEDGAGKKELTMRFHGDFPSIGSAREKITRGIAYVEDGVIGDEGVFLPSSSLWYPREYGTLHTARVEADVPAGYTAVMEGEVSSRNDEDGRTVWVWDVEKPVDGVNLVAARYVVDEETYNGVRIATYFFKEDKGLSRTYIGKSKEYLDLYGEMIAPYPYKKFAVVENFLPTGYGMPSYTLLGSTVLRLPFIPDTSLGHEIAHNWWGNSVFMDDAGGNWVEALTTYTSDYLYARKKGDKDARKYRVERLHGYMNFAGDKGTPLDAFTNATTPASRAVGYDKGMMVFNMLEDELGKDTFNRGLRNLYNDFAFRRASWDDIRASFEAASKADLGWFFTQWLTRAGGPEPKLGKVEILNKDDGHSVAFTVEQLTAEPYRLKLPVEFRTSDGNITKEITVTGKTEKVEIKLPSAPLGFTIDPDYRVFRILRPEEMPPSFATCFGADKTIIVSPEGKKAALKYAGVSELFSKDYGLERATDAEAGIRDFLAEKSLFILGWPDENRVSRLAGQHLSRWMSFDEKTFNIEGRKYDRPGAVAAIAVKNVSDPSKTICFLVSGAGEEDTLKAAARLRYFSGAGYVVFPGGERVEKGRFEGGNTLAYEAGKE